MKKNLTSLSKNIHLAISALIVVVVGAIYGLKPRLLFDIHPKTTDEYNIFKAIMGLYFAFGMFWFLAIFNNKFWKIATMSNMLFMFGLAYGRLISMIFDGIPSTIFVLGTFGEIGLGSYAFYIFKRFSKT